MTIGGWNEGMVASRSVNGIELSLCATPLVNHDPRLGFANAHYYWQLQLQVVAQLYQAI